MLGPHTISPLFPYTTLFRSGVARMGNSGAMDTQRRLSRNRRLITLITLAPMIPQTLPPARCLSSARAPARLRQTAGPANSLRDHPNHGRYTILVIQTCIRPPPAV